MKRIHLLHVDAPAATFEPLFQAAQEAGVRLGWLRLDSPAPEGVETLPDGLDFELTQAANLGALRAVHGSAAGTVSVKARRGAPVLRDLLREHFLGCAAVLVTGDLQAAIQAPGEELPVNRLQVHDQGWRVSHPDTGERTFSAADLARALGRPSLWPT